MAAYTMRQRWLRLGDSFTVRNAQGEVAYQVRGRILRVRKTSVIEDARGGEVATVREVLLSLDRTESIEIGGAPMGKLRRTNPNALKSTFEVEILGKVEMKVKDTGFKDFRVERDARTVATIRKRDLGLLDTYDISIFEGEDEVLLLAVAVALDHMDESSD